MFYGILQVYATMRNPSAWDAPSQENIVVAALDVTSEESIANLVKDIIQKEGNIINANTLVVFRRCYAYSFQLCSGNNILTLFISPSSCLHLDWNVTTALQYLGKIDILINNAGYGLGGYIESITIDEAKVSFFWNYPAIYCKKKIWLELSKCSAHNLRSHDQDLCNFNALLWFFPLIFRHNLMWTYGAWFVCYKAVSTF